MLRNIYGRFGNVKKYWWLQKC